MRSIILLCICLLLIAPVSALSSTLESPYRQGETNVIELFGSIREPITPAQVTFLRGHVEVPFVYDIKRFDNHYFLYFITPNVENNYTLVIRDIATTANGQNTVETFEQNFSTTNKTAPFTIRPALILTNGDVQLDVTLNEDQARTITLTARNELSKTLQPGANTLYIEASELSQGINEVTLDDYRVIAYSTRENQPEDSWSKVLRVDPVRVKRVFTYGGSEASISFEVTNRGLVDLTDVTFTYDSDRYELSTDEIDVLKVNETREITITLAEEVSFTDAIILHSGNETIELPLEVVYQDEFILLPGQQSNSSFPNASTASRLYCRELNGQICSTGQQCSGESTNALDGQCCRGSCTAAEEGSGTSWIGYLLAAIVLIILLIVGGRYWKTRSNAKAASTIESKVKKLEKPY